MTYSPVTRKSLTRHEKIGRVGRVTRMLRAYEYVAAEVTDLSRVGRVHADVTRMLRYEEEDTRKLLLLPCCCCDIAIVCLSVCCAIGYCLCFPDIKTVCLANVAH